jgi:hypothetical protein
MTLPQRAFLPLGAALAFAFLPGAHADPAFTTFNVPGATQTYVAALADDGAVSGTAYIGEVPHGFVRAPDGTVATFGIDGANYIETTCMNDRGTVAGDFDINGQPVQGFLRNAAGKIKTFTVTGAAGLAVRSINAKGWIAGTYETSDTNWHGFMRAPDGAVTSFDVPDATTTAPRQIRDDNTIVGAWSVEGGPGTDTGFVRTPEGTLSTFGIAQGNYVDITGITRGGAMTGSYWNGKRQQGFLSLHTGKAVKIDPPGSVYTAPLAIGAGNVIVGEYQDDAKVIHGFVRIARGQYETVDPPGARSSRVVAVNAHGVISGYYSAPNDRHVHGFVATP